MEFSLEGIILLCDWDKNLNIWIMDLLFSNQTSRTTIQISNNNCFVDSHLVKKFYLLRQSIKEGRQTKFSNFENWPLLFLWWPSINQKRTIQKSQLLGKAAFSVHPNNPIQELQSNHYFQYLRAKYRRTSFNMNLGMHFNSWTSTK